MAPVTAHPLSEVSIIIIIVVHDESRQEPERHDGVVREPLGADDERVIPAEWHRAQRQSWAARRYLIYYTALRHRATVTRFN